MKIQEEKENLLMIEQQAREFSYYITTSHLFSNLFGRTQLISFPKYSKRKASKLEEHFTCGYGTRNRGLHTMDIRWASSYVATQLGLSRDIAEASSYGHDVGHSPFGHEGEEALGFCHGKQSVRLFKINRILNNPLINRAIETHSGGDELINKQIVYERDECANRSLDLMKITDDLCVASSDQFDLIREGLGTQQLIDAICEALGIKQSIFSKSEIAIYHFSLLKGILDDLAKNSLGQKGLYLSDKKFKMYKRLKSIIYDGYIPKVKATKIAKDKSIVRLLAVAEKISYIISREVNDGKNRLVRDVQQFLRAACYEELPDSTVKELTIDFLTNSCTDDLILYYHRNCLK